MDNNELDNHDAIGLVAILCSLLVIAVLVAGVTGALMLSAKLVGWKGALVLPAVTDFHTHERMVFCARRPLLHRINARRWAMLGGCVVAFIALFLAGVLK